MQPGESAKMFPFNAYRMFFFDSYSINYRIYLSFVLNMIIAITLTVISIVKVNELDNGIRQINEVNNVKQLHALSNRGIVHDQSTAIRDIVLLSTPSQREATIHEIARLQEAYTKNSQQLRTMIGQANSGADERAMLDSIDTVQQKTLPIMEKIIALRSEGSPESDAEAHRLLMDTAAPLFNDWRAAINRFVELQSTLNEQIQNSVQNSASNFQSAAILSQLAATLIGIVIAVMIGRSIAGPISKLVKSMELLAKGKIDIDIPGVNLHDQIGQMARSVLVFRDNAVEKRTLAAQQEQATQLDKDRAEHINALIHNFEQRTSVAIEEVHKAAAELSSASSELSKTSLQVEEEAKRAAYATGSASQSVMIAAGAAEELAASIQEVASQASRSHMVAGRAVEEANQTFTTMESLAATAAHIGEVVDLIQTISEQTNLLALNATIEAARAGDAGRGFSVVANEVKSLANRTAQATQEISGQISAIQAASGHAVTAIQNINATIGDMSTIALAVATAVEQQAGAVQSIAASVAHSSNELQVGAEAMSRVEETVGQSKAISGSVARHAGILTQDADMLDSAIVEFLNGVKNA